MSEILTAFHAISEFGPAPSIILCGHTQHAIIEAIVKFQGRDRRRVKREVNRAIARAAFDRRKTL